ncbi:MAG: SAM-dependent DNA methyltransferase [Bacteroidetes bacterium]|nr:SAM-dependent DNA methyltransferase [Bacteroidota bacterium]
MVPSVKQKASSDSGSFANSLLSIASRFSIFTVFDDFLTMAICACSQNPHTGKSHYEDEYLQTIAKYKDSELRHEFPKAFAYLVNEMELRVHDQSGNDVLGEFYEEHLSKDRNGQYFTPFTVCMFMASITHPEKKETGEPLRILDPACGSGRMLIASHRTNGTGNEFYGIDIDPTCIKMAALNLFLNGMWHSEVMCANALMPGDFSFAYRISLLPFGIFKINNKEDSRLWHMNLQSFTKEPAQKKSDTIILDSTPFSERKKDDATQLGLF